MSVLGLCNRTVTLSRRAWSNVRGQRTIASTTTATVAASLQPLAAERRGMHGLDAGVLAYTAYFAADPALAVNDLVTDAALGALSVLAPARDQAGRTRCWAVDCAAVNPS